MQGLVFNIYQRGIDYLYLAVKDVANENLIKRLANTYEFCDGDLNKFFFDVKIRCLSIKIEG